VRTEFARAKINLTLHVGRVITDADRFYGYHPLDSLVVFADIGDRIDVKPSNMFELNIGGPFGERLEPGEDNLITRAVRASERLGANTDVCINLDKVLPIASGIGGGSADAAATLRALNPDTSKLSDVALRLGADVPVCLLSQTVRMTGIGETLSPIPGLGQVSAVLVNPGVSVSTGEIFRAFDSGEVRETPRPQKLSGSLLERARDGRNDLQLHAMKLVPEIKDVIESLEQSEGCDLARMSGSGATCFGLFKTDAQAQIAAKMLSQRGWWVAACRLGDGVGVQSKVPTA